MLNQQSTVNGPLPSRNAASFGVVMKPCTVPQRSDVGPNFCAVLVVTAVPLAVQTRAGFASSRNTVPPSAPSMCSKILV